MKNRLAGIILGTAVGDALGLPAEGISRKRMYRMFSGPWRHRFLFGHGMVSDDTEHTFFVAQSLLAQPRDAADDQSGYRHQSQLAGVFRLHGPLRRTEFVAAVFHRRVVQRPLAGERLTAIF